MQFLRHNEVLTDGGVLKTIGDFFVQARGVPAIARAE